MVDKKHLHSIRIGLENWLYEDRFEHLLRLLKEYRGGITDVALFTTPTHTPLPWMNYSNISP